MSWESGQPSLDAIPESPLQRLGSLSGANEVWMKRDDLIPFSFGGNKARISVSLLEDMRAKGCDCMVAYGSARSNLVRAISNLCSASGVPCSIIVPYGNDSDSGSANLILARRFGAEITRCARDGVREAVEGALERARLRGYRPYYAFGDSTGVGNEMAQVSAYVAAYREVLAQEERMGLPFDVIAHASGTGMTQAGLVCGQEVYGGSHRIVGISIARSRAQGLPHVERRVRAYLESRSVDPTRALSSLEFRDEWVSGGYGRDDVAVSVLVDRMMRLEGVPTDPTYVGKGLYGLLSLLESEGVSGSRVLFIHTGGTPLFFDHLAERGDHA